MRLIDADAYAAELWKMRQNYQMLDDTQTADKIMHGLYRAEQALKEAPTVDAVPVVHGEWVSEWGGWLGLTLTVKCSICGADALYRYDGDDADVDRVCSHYCPNCGCRMDGKEKTHE